MPFISANIQSQEWKLREAATLAFGSILDGPSSEVLGTLVDQAVPMMISHMVCGASSPSTYKWCANPTPATPGLGGFQ